MRCIVTDADGKSVTSNVVKAVNPDATLKITTHPKDITVNEGDDAKFSVKVSGGKTPYKYEWHFALDGGDRIAENPSWFENWETDTITVKNCEESVDNGYEYYCIITDADGTKVTSEKATLSVK